MYNGLKAAYPNVTFISTAYNENPNYNISIPAGNAWVRISSGKNIWTATQSVHTSRTSIITKHPPSSWRTSISSTIGRKELVIPMSRSLSESILSTKSTHPGRFLAGNYPFSLDILIITTVARSITQTLSMSISSTHNFFPPSERPYIYLRWSATPTS